MTTGDAEVEIERPVQPAGGRWVERHDYALRVFSRAPAETVYDLLASLPTHLEWSGRRLGERAERLITMESSALPAREGTAFTSSGWTSIGTFHDRSRVIVAERPVRFEFETLSTLELKDGTPLSSTWTHRFDLEPSDDGTWIARTDRQTRFYHPAPWWVRLLAVPPIAMVGYRLMARATALATLRNLRDMAEEVARAGREGQNVATLSSARRPGGTD